MEKFDERATRSHEIVTTGTINLYKIQFVLELGIGEFSTPIFRGVDYIGVENNLEWVEHIRGKFPELRILHHDMGEMKSSDSPDSLTIGQIAEVQKYYNDILIPDIHPNLLFVDGFAALRTLAINTIGHKFDYIIYHDSECSFYQYDKINLKGYHVINYPTNPNTTLMIKK